MKKICQTCHDEKQIEDFGIDRSKKDGRLIYCKLCHRENQKKYYKLHAEEKRLRAKNYRELHKNDPTFKAKKKIQDQRYREENQDKIKQQLLETRDERLKRRRELRRKHYEENPAFFLLQASKCRAAKKKWEHTITEDDIKIPKICPIFGIPIILGKKYQSENSPSIDRIDNNKGYTKDNIIVVSWKANELKGSATIDELEKIVNFYKKL